MRQFEMSFIRIFLICPCLIFGVQALPALEERTAAVHANNRESRGLHMLNLKDPLDCLSQVVCGLNTNPPQKPSVRTNTANDFAFLLKGAIGKLRSQKVTTTTTTTVAPVTTKKTTPHSKPQDDDDEDEEEDEGDDIDNELDYEGNNDYSDLLQNGRHQFKRSSVFSRRRGDSSKNKRSNKKKSRGKLRQKNPQSHGKIYKQPRPMSPLQRLRMETDLRAKLLSDAKCSNGLIDHSCPFNYQQMLSLMSSSLERERTVSYTSNKVLPMVGYLIKSRNYTGTLEATFTAIERINNYTIEADREGKPIDFSHILDEVMNRNTGDNGLRIVDTSNDSASASVWEDDEFDHVLENPYVRRRPSSENYKLAKKKKQQKATPSPTSDQEADDGSTTSEEDTSEEGLVFDRPRPPPYGTDQSSSEEDDRNQEVFEESSAKKKKPNKESLLPPPVFGHIQKSAEDE